MAQATRNVDGLDRLPGLVSRARSRGPNPLRQLCSYLRTICCRNAGARLARLSYVEPRVITVVGSARSDALEVGSSDRRGSAFWSGWSLKRPAKKSPEDAI